jgi:hypothetical protein
MAAGVGPLARMLTYQHATLISAVSTYRILLLPFQVSFI